MFEDPYPRDEKRFVCLDCRQRTVTEEHPGNCPDCDGRLRNIAVPRE